MPKSNQQNEYALTNVPPNVPPPINEPEDLNPPSRASLLRRHRKPNEERGDDERSTTHLQTVSGTGILARLSSIMSRDPLLSRSISTQGTGSYGMVPDFNATNEAPDRDGVDGTKDRDRSKAKSSAVGPDHPAAGSRHRQESRSSSQDTTDTTEGDEVGNSGEETINVDGNISDENPPDDSP